MAVGQVINIPPNVPQNWLVTPDQSVTYQGGQHNGETKPCRSGRAPGASAGDARALLASRAAGARLAPLSQFQD